MPKKYADEDSSSSSSSDSDSDIEQQKRRSSKSKPKKKKTAEDLLDKKLKSKKKKEKKSAKAEDALEEKIRKKQAAAVPSYAAAASASGSAAAASGSTPGAHASRGMSGGVAAVRKAAKQVPPTYSSSGRNGEEKVEEDEEANRDSGDDTTNNNDALFTRGGGDVRTRPKVKPNAASQQSSSSQTKQIDPLRAAEEEKKKKAKPINPRYADLHETGSWGGLGKWEKRGLGILALGAIGAAIALGIIFSKGSDGDVVEQTPQPTPSPTEIPTVSPTPAPTVGSYRETHGLELMTASSPKLSLPQTPEALVGAKFNPESTPQEIAAEYVLYDDAMQYPATDSRFMERYALSVFYLSNGGCDQDWVDSTNWMSLDLDHCDNWFGIKCTLQGNVEEIILKENYVSGKIPMEMNQFKELRALDLSNNVMTGSIPGVTLGGLTKLFSLQLQNNGFSGEFPFEEFRNGATSLGEFYF